MARADRRPGIFGRWLRHLVCAVGLLLVAAGGAAAAGKRVVGIVYDDSGSMAGRSNLPAFAAQLLASSLDVAGSRDRLFSIRLSTFDKAQKRADVAAALAPGVSPASVAALRALGVPDMPRTEAIGATTTQSVIDTIRTEWSKPSSDTPYGPIEIMLDALVEATEPGDEAYFLILTDGAFNGPLPVPAALAQDYAAYKARLKGTLRFNYVLIAPPGATERVGGQDLPLERVVEAQGVREALARSFNGSPTDGTFVVQNSDDLMTAMFDIIARINTTERTGAGGTVTVDGARLLIDSPISLSRFVGITVADSQAGLATVKPGSFAEPPVARFRSAMAEADRNPGWGGQKQEAATIQYRFAQALPPGHIAVEFDRPISADRLFLFDSLARFELGLVDERGAAVRQAADGIAEVAKGQSLYVTARLIDSGPGGDVPVDATALTGATAKAFLVAPGSSTDLALAADGPNKRFVAQAPTGSTGTFEVGGSFSLAGFVRKEAQRLRFRVVDNRAVYEVRLTATGCPACAAGQLATTLRRGTSVETVGTLTLTQRIGPPAPVRMALQAAPPWLTLRDAAGRVIGPEDAVPMDAKGQATVSIVRDLDRPDEAQTYERPFRIALSAVPPFEGSSAVEGSVRVIVPQVTLDYLGKSIGADGAGAPPLDATAGPLTLDAAALARGDGRFRFRAKSSVDTLRLGDFAVAPISWFVDLVPGLERDAGRAGTPDETVSDADVITVTAKSRWCACALLLAGGQIDVTLAGPGGKTVTAPLRVAPSWTEIGWSCGSILAGLLAVIWLIGAVATFLRAARFPPGSTVTYVPRGADIESHTELRAWDGRGNWRTVFGSLVWRICNARASVLGLSLEARRGGATIFLQDSSGSVKIENEARTIAALLKEDPQRESLPIYWRDRFSDHLQYRWAELRKT
ncbi:hypothetical protein [Labrys wisconsinensis]|uniref:VWFA domain-containing protein n=1 Tax=Labrys wisconsinensis TaxID=425677 RepID=A0ABU0J5Q4_9HYPH|nr:hypothetical protein [Labrys wisconsinensis]MDQ0469564.1 hypothetical protein [Labrys wisconsinensis]